MRKNPIDDRLLIDAVFRLRPDTPAYRSR